MNRSIYLRIPPLFSSTLFCCLCNSAPFLLVASIQLCPSLLAHGRRLYCLRAFCGRGLCLLAESSHAKKLCFNTGNDSKRNLAKRYFFSTHFSVLGLHHAH